MFSSGNGQLTSGYSPFNTQNPGGTIPAFFNSFTGQVRQGVCDGAILRAQLSNPNLRQRLLLSHGLAGGRALPSLGLPAIFGMMQRLDLTDNERAVLITALRRLVDFDPRSLSPQTHALKAILERLEPHKPQPIPDTAGTG